MTIVDNEHREDGLFIILVYVSDDDWYIEWGNENDEKNWQMRDFDNSEEAYILYEEMKAELGFK